MAEILNKLGIHWAPLCAQILIFGAVYLILAKYAFGPVTAILEERRRRIAEGEDNLKSIKENLAGSEAKAAEILAKANADGDRLIKEAKDAAAAVGEVERQKALAEAASIVTKAKAASELERNKVMGELKRDFGRLIVETTSRVTGKTLSEDDKARLNREAIAHAGSN